MKAGFDALGRLRLQAIFLLAAVFAIGVLAGVAFERARTEPGHWPGPGGPEPMGLPPELRGELQLTPDQEQRIRGVLEHHRQRMDGVLKECFPRMQAVIDSARAEMRAVLTPEQQEIFDRHEPAGFPRGLRPPPGGRPPGQKRHRSEGDRFR